MTTAPEKSPAPTAVLPPDRDPATVYLEGLAEGGGRVAMRSALKQVARLLSGESADSRTLPWHELRRRDVRELRTQLEQRYQPATVNKALSAVRGCLKAAWRLGLMTADDYHKAVDVPNMRESKRPAGRALAKSEIAALLDVCRKDSRPAGPRDSAALALMVGTGLKKAEAVGVRIEDYDPVGMTIRVVGKGGRERVAYLSAGGPAIIAAWLQVRGARPGPLLCPINPSGWVDVRPLSGQALILRLKERCRQAGIRPCSPRDLRRTFISHLLKAGAGLAAVQRLAGHASPGTTLRYDHRGEPASRQAISRLHVLT